MKCEQLLVLFLSIYLFLVFFIVRQLFCLILVDYRPHSPELLVLFRSRLALILFHEEFNLLLELRIDYFLFSDLV